MVAGRICLAALLALPACGGTSAGAPGPEEAAAGGSEAPPGEVESPASPSCSTSEDCADDLICVDSECVMPVPPGFY